MTVRICNIEMAQRKLFSYLFSDTLWWPDFCHDKLSTAQFPNRISSMNERRNWTENEEIRKVHEWRASGQTSKINFLRVLFARCMWTLERMWSRVLCAIFCSFFFRSVSVSASHKRRYENDKNDSERKSGRKTSIKNEKTSEEWELKKKEDTKLFSTIALSVRLALRSFRTFARIIFTILSNFVRLPQFGNRTCDCHLPKCISCNANSTRHKTVPIFICLFPLLFSLFHFRSRLFYFSLIFHLLGQIMHKFILSLSHKILFHFSLHPSFLVVTARRRKCWPCENTTIVSKRRRHDERMKTLLLLSTNRENFRSSFSFSSARWFYNVFAFSKFPFENEQKARWILFIQCMNSWQLLVKQ